eukprot:TRINITY_DN14676_c0_g1_i3.p1 TRINITY_DN14676_c0_g1~~TRINITY_DN14676_c0_g1_i3.p1  ORF type:complete len:148 (-),score=11.34 TRINITY_DN14676_c0_g1_i3:159-602(-)
MAFQSFNNTAFHHPQMGTLGPQPRYSHVTDGVRVEGPDIQYRVANRGMPQQYTGASYVRETNGSPVETVWTWGHPSNASSAWHRDSINRMPAPYRRYPAPSAPEEIPAQMADLNYAAHPYHAAYPPMPVAPASGMYMGPGLAPHPRP